MTITISKADRSDLEGLVTIIETGIPVDIDRAAAIIQSVSDHRDEGLAGLLSAAEQAVSDLEDEGEHAEANAAYAIECINSVIDYRAPEVATPTPLHLEQKADPITMTTVSTEETLAAIRQIVVHTTLLGGDEANAFRLISEIVSAAGKAAKAAA